jgi:WD40 repeat protein
MGYSKSDNIEDELLSCVLLKKSKKLCIGTQDGTLCLYTYGQWSDMSDRFPGHPQSIDAILKIDEDTILTGSSDGLIRAVQLLPNSLLGVLGGHDHDGFPVEGLGWGAERRLVGSISHDEYIRLWDASLLNDDDDDIDDDIDDGNNIQEENELTKTKTGDDSDDWDDMDEDDNSEDDDDSDDDDDNSNDGAGSGKPKKREKIFKTDNESFFFDL